MGEFDKNQDKTDQTDQQGEKPAFGQFDKEQGQQNQGDTEKQDEFSDKEDKTL